MISINCNSAKEVFKNPTINFNALFNSLDTERDHRDRSIVRGKFDLDEVSPDGCNVQELRHAGRACPSF